VVQIGRFASGIDKAAVGPEFQQADCSPKETGGDGRIDLADWVQAGRFAAGLDTATNARGPNAPVTAPQSLLALRIASQRRISLLSPAPDAGSVRVILTSGGDENGLSFSVGFNPAAWRFISARPGNAASTATLLVNTNEVMHGRVGFMLALPPGLSFTPGEDEFVVLTFEPVARNRALPLKIDLADAPVRQSAAGTDAHLLSLNPAQP